MSLSSTCSYVVEISVGFCYLQAYCQAHKLPFPVLRSVCCCCRYTKKIESEKDDKDTKEEVEADDD